ncbi:hypothetical protein CRYUN_Cryun06bG0180700 [Craigia yunnanensis]
MRSPHSHKKLALLSLVCATAFFVSSSFRNPIFFLLSLHLLSFNWVQTNRGLGLTAYFMDHCKLVLKFPQGTNCTWYNDQFKIYEPLEYSYDICDTILLWEQYRNMTTVLTREYLDVRPDGWLDYAAKRIAQLYDFLDTYSIGDLLKTNFGKEIDSHDAVIQDNEAPVNEELILDLQADFSVSQLKYSVSFVSQSIPNPVYLFQGIVLRRGAKGTGMKSIELALSMCDIVDIYGFTVNPGYTEWTRYYSTPRKGHNPLQGRAYYQLLECLGVIRIHSPMRAKRKQDWSDVPSQEMINKAHAAALHIKRGAAGLLGQFGSCKVWGNMDPDKNGPISRSPDMSGVRKHSNYSKWEIMPLESLRKEAQDHYAQMEGVSLYKMDGNKLDDLVCVRHSLKSEG